MRASNGKWYVRFVVDGVEYSEPTGLEATERNRKKVQQAEAAARQLVIDGVAVPLTPLQFNLLRHFSSHPVRVIERDELVQAVWGRAFVGSNVVDASIRSLRKKLGAHASAIETVTGFGYRFRPQPS